MGHIALSTAHHKLAKIDHVFLEQDTSMEWIEVYKVIMNAHVEYTPSESDGHSWSPIDR